jgi:hypothetical protein
MTFYEFIKSQIRNIFLISANKFNPAVTIKLHSAWVQTASNTTSAGAWVEGLRQVKTCLGLIGVWNLDIVCYLLFGAWNFLFFRTLL